MRTRGYHKDRKEREDIFYELCDRICVLAVDKDCAQCGKDVLSLAKGRKVRQGLRTDNSMHEICPELRRTFRNSNLQMIDEKTVPNGWIGLRVWKFNSRCLETMPLTQNSRSSTEVLGHCNTSRRQTHDHFWIPPPNTGNRHDTRGPQLSSDP